MKLLFYTSIAGQYFAYTKETEFSSEFETAFKKYVTEGGLAASIKEVKYEYFETIFNSFKHILSYADNVKKQISIFLVLEIAHKCLNSDYLSVRVHGVKEIESYCSRIFKGRLVTDVKKDDLGEWLSTHNVISSIFGSNHHSELISRTEYILKTLSRSKTGIKKEEIELIWSLTRRDKQTKKEIYHLLQQVGESLGNEFIEFIMDRIKEYEHLSHKDLEFMYSFKNKTDLQNECTWKILNDPQDYTEDVVKTAFEKLIDNVKFTTMSKKLTLMHDCIEKIKNHKSSLIFLKILKSVIN